MQQKLAAAIVYEALTEPLTHLCCLQARLLVNCAPIEHIATVNRQLVGSKSSSTMFSSSQEKQPLKTVRDPSTVTGGVLSGLACLRP